MTVNINDKEVEILLSRIVSVTGESETEAVRKALSDRLEKITQETVMVDANIRKRVFLETELWPQIPKNLLGTKLSKEEEETILGFEDDFPKNDS